MLSEKALMASPALLNRVGNTVGAMASRAISSACTPATSSRAVLPNIRNQVGNSTRCLSTAATLSSTTISTGNAQNAAVSTGVRNIFSKCRNGFLGTRKSWNLHSANPSISPFMQRIRSFGTTADGFVNATGHEAGGAASGGSRQPGNVLPKRPKKKAKTSYTQPVLLLVGCAAIGATIAFQDEIFEKLESLQLGDSFEEFNYTTHEKLMDIAEWLVPSKPAPWLLDFETMKYPPHLPTLVVDLDKLVCKLEYERHAGWQVKKRPGADKFFQELQHYYEIVVFSEEMFPVAADIMMKWGIPCGGILHREFCRQKRNHFVKDISKLGRNLERVIHIDHDPVAVERYPENSIILTPYNGDETDTELYDLIEFLKAAMHSPDVRDFIKKYGGDNQVGKRYLLEKQEREQLVNSRRAMFSGFGGGNGRMVKRDPTGRRV